MELSRERITTTARQRTERNHPSLIKFITKDPKSRSWSEIRLNSEIPKHQERRRTELLQLSKENESEARRIASLCTERLVMYGEPMDQPAVKVSDNNNGTCQWVLSIDQQFIT